MNFKIITFGCKLNQAESDKISADLILQGFELNNTEPDLIIINACAVTHKAVRTGRQTVTRLKREFPEAKIIVTGCIDESNWPEVDLWIKNKDKDKLPQIIYSEELATKNPVKSLEHGILHSVQDKLVCYNRAFIKIQTGCYNFCSYCIVPFLRGEPKSIPADKIIKDIKNKEAQGYKEIVLTGVNIGLYSDGAIGLVRLLETILKKTDIKRIRLGSLWPTHINSKLINLYSKNPRLCPHFHLSIQSGSDKILKAMNRNYTAKRILEITKKCRAKIPNINFTTDIIVGFPGETEVDFQDSCNLISKVGFSKVHIFKYSKRPQTKAAEMKNQVDEKIKNTRVKVITKLADEVALKTKQKFIGKNLSVLWEGYRAGYFYGFADNYIRIKKPGKNLSGKIEDIKIDKQNLI